MICRFDKKILSYIIYEINFLSLAQKTIYMDFEKSAYQSKLNLINYLIPS